MTRRRIGIPSKSRGIAPETDKVMEQYAFRFRSDFTNDWLADVNIVPTIASTSNRFRLYLAVRNISNTPFQAQSWLKYSIFDDGWTSLVSSGAVPLYMGVSGNITNDADAAQTITTETYQATNGGQMEYALNPETGLQIGDRTFETCTLAPGETAEMVAVIGMENPYLYSGDEMWFRLFPDDPEISVVLTAIPKFVVSKVGGGRPGGGYGG